MNEAIINYLQEQNYATICCVSDESRPWCFSCCYVFNRVGGVIYYKSSRNALHSVLIKKNPYVAGTILPDRLSGVLLKGIQFDGLILEASHPATEHAAVQYYKKIPVALAIPGDISTIQISHIKMTDSTLGFTKKTIWTRPI